MRHISLYCTRLLVPTRVSPNLVTSTMFVTGPGAALAATVPRWWSAVVALVVIQLQGYLDCVDGELARWRGQTGPSGVFLDRLGHYVTDAALAVGIGVRADGGLGHVGGWTTLGLAAACLILLVKAQTDLVLVARYQTGGPLLPDEAAVAAPRPGPLRQLRRLLAVMPLNRALLAMEMTFLLMVVAIVAAVASSDVPAQVLTAALLAVAGFVTVARLPSILSSARLR
jgi:phosphatidylglycerophosphate synthase